MAAEIKPTPKRGPPPIPEEGLSGLERTINAMFTKNRITGHMITLNERAGELKVLLPHATGPLMTAPERTKTAGNLIKAAVGANTGIHVFIEPKPGEKRTEFIVQLPKK